MDLDERVRIFPYLRPGFASLASLARKSYPLPPTHLPQYPPCFAFADLIWDSALNLVRYTAVCMLRLVLPSTSATHTLFPLSPLPSVLTHLPTLCTHTQGAAHRWNHLVSCFYHPRSHSLTSGDCYTSLIFFSIVSPLLFSLLPFLPLCLYSSFFLFISQSLSL